MATGKYLFLLATCVATGKYLFLLATCVATGNYLFLLATCVATVHIFLLNNLYKIKFSIFHKLFNTYFI